MLEAAAAQAQVSIVEADAARLPALAERFAIRSVPTLVLFRGGEAVGRKVGFSTAAELRRWVDEAGPGAAERGRAQ
jgi:thioredoxin 2